MRSNDWLMTICQTLPRIPSVLRLVRPTIHLGSVADISRPLLQEHGVRAIVWDVDGTLMPHGGRRVEPSIEKRLNELFSCPEFCHAILSNASEARYCELASLFPEVPVVRAYTSYEGMLYRRRIGSDDSWTRDELERQLALSARVIRKPNRLLVDYALSVLGCEDRKSVMMVGDQYLTDIAGANMAGILSIKVSTLGRESFPRPVQFLQRIDELAFRIMSSVPQTWTFGLKSPPEQDSS